MSRGRALLQRTFVSMVSRECLESEPFIVKSIVSREQIPCGIMMDSMVCTSLVDKLCVYS